MKKKYESTKCSRKTEEKSKKIGVKIQAKAPFDSKTHYFVSHTCIL